MTRATPPDVSLLEAVSTSIDRLQRVAGRVGERLSDELGLTEVAAQALVAVAEGARTVSSVAEATGRHVSTASRTVDGLVQADLVSRQEDPQDRRAVRLTLTPRGAATARRVEDYNREVIASSLTDLPAEDVAELARLLGALADAAERSLPPLD